MSPAAHLFSHPVACFSVNAIAEPGILPRVIEVFAKRGLIPSRIDTSLVNRHEPEIIVDIQIASLEDHRPAQIANVLRQIVGVETVLTSEKHVTAETVTRAA
jgi:acetolactate synthase small subunit